MISSPAGKVESAPRHHFEGTSYRRRARERAGRPSWKNKSDAATYEKQNEGACAAASVLSEAPGAFLHFHPLLHLTRPDRGCPPPCRDPCVPPRPPPDIPPRQQPRSFSCSSTFLHPPLLLSRSFASSSAASSSGEIPVFPTIPRVPPSRDPPPRNLPLAFLHFNTFLNGWKNK